jgi:hypothetical protein
MPDIVHDGLSFFLLGVDIEIATKKTQRDQHVVCLAVRQYILQNSIYSHRTIKG